MVIYLTLKFAFRSLGGLEIEFAAFFILDALWLVGLWPVFLYPQLKKRLAIRGIEPQAFHLLDESTTTELSGLVIKSMIEKAIYITS